MWRFKIFVREPKHFQTQKTLNCKGYIFSNWTHVFIWLWKLNCVGLGTALNIQSGQNLILFALFLGNNTLEIGDTSSLSPYQHGGIITQVKMPQKHSFVGSHFWTIHILGILKNWVLLFSLIYRKDWFLDKYVALAKNCEMYYFRGKRD